MADRNELKRNQVATDLTARFVIIFAERR